ncbi:MAG: hypothetical protein DMG13_20270 [Acidobacteria bacterium]|nr:MAG: hypothetical protein DMG13_20270 [Acidobacteriota bacterium]
MGSNNSWLNNQLRIGILRWLGIGRHDLLVRGPRQSAERWRRQCFSATTAATAGFILIWRQRQNQILWCVNKDSRLIDFRCLRYGCCPWNQR